MYNAARITRAYGTAVMKGDPTADRPHRRSGLLYMPPELRVVPVTAWQRLAALRRRDEPPPRVNGYVGGFELREFLQRHGIQMIPRTNAHTPSDNLLFSVVAMIMTCSVYVR